MATPFPIIPAERISHAVILFSFSSPSFLKTFRAGKRIKSVSITVETAFNAAASMSIGTLGTPNLLMDASDSDLRTLGEYIVHPDYLTAGGENINVFINPGASTAGEVFILIKYV